MEQINKNTPLEKGDLVYFKRKGSRFEDFCVKCFGVLREYDNKNSLSGCCERVYRIYTISGKLEEHDNWVFCWYKESFLLLSQEDKKVIDLTEENMINQIGIEVYKLSEEEKEKTLSFINNTKIVENLE